MRFSCTTHRSSDCRAHTRARRLDQAREAGGGLFPEFSHRKLLWLFLDSKTNSSLGATERLPSSAGGKPTHGRRVLGFAHIAYRLACSKAHRHTQQNGGADAFENLVWNEFHFAVGRPLRRCTACSTGGTTRDLFSFFIRVGCLYNTSVLMSAQEFWRNYLSAPLDFPRAFAAAPRRRGPRIISSKHKVMPPCSTYRGSQYIVRHGADSSRVPVCAVRCHLQFAGHLTLHPAPALLLL